MNLNPFTWLRNAARNAIIGGVADAFNDLQEAAGDPAKPVTLADIQTRLQLTAGSQGQAQTQSQPHQLAQEQEVEEETESTTTNATGTATGTGNSTTKRGAKR